MRRKLHTREKETIRLFPLGGIVGVTKNLFVYEYRISGKLIDILLVDCGIGFPDETMYGVDLIIPDISYLRDKKDKIRGLVLTHGHDDHIGALPYILPKLPSSMPIYGSKLTIAFAESKLQEFGINRKGKVISSKNKIKLGNFWVEPIHVTHSVPDSTHLIIETRAGVFYHGSDFKFDLTPLDNRPSELNKIAAAGDKNVVCLLSDCLGSERKGHTLSERVIEDTLEKELRNCGKKFIFTTQSSNISRIQLAIDVALRHRRKIAFIGRSIDQNTRVASRLGFMKFPRQALIYDKQILRHPDNQLFLIIAGSQGQTSSGLARISRGEHKFVKISDGDTVLISADPIPGNENEVHVLIDSLIQLGAKVVYSDIMDDIHVSGHGGIHDLQLLLSLTKPKYALPIGGTYRHMMAYRELACDMGYKAEDILIPQNGDVLEFSLHTNPKVVQNVSTQQVMIDGLGIGDVGQIVLRDRQTLATEGIVVIVIPLNKSTGTVSAEPDIISRGFVYMKESGKLVDQTKKLVARELKLKKGRILNWHHVKRQIDDKVSRFLYKETKRSPLIVPVVVEV